MLRRTFVALILASAPLFAWAEDSWKGVDRIVAVGDVHGDLDAFVTVLRSAGVLDSRNRWSGGKTHLVQTGDVTDRGPDSRKVMDLLMALEKQARSTGGRVHTLLGNHETMNVFGDLRYVTAAEYASYRGPDAERLRELLYQQHVNDLKKTTAPEGLPAFDDAYKRKWMASYPPGYVEHRQAFSPQGLYGKWIREHPVAIRINDIVFVHGGLSPKYADVAIRDLNRRAAEELQDFSKLQGGMIIDPEGPLWYRGLAEGDEEQLAPHLTGVLERLEAKTMVIAHTPTRGFVLPRFGGRVLMIDVGLSQHYGGHRACLLFENGKAYGIHRGKRLEMPATPADLALYQAQVAHLEKAAQ